MKLQKGMKPVISAGHGGMIFKVYQCLAGGKQYTHKNGKTIHEGVINRMMASKLMWKLYLLEVPFGELQLAVEDMSLSKRVAKFNKMYAKDKDIYLFSIHNNAGKGKGSEAWTSKGQTKSDIICDKILENIEQEFSIAKMRYDTSDGDRDKEANYTMVKDTNGPAMIFEFGFFDSSDIEWLLNDTKIDELLDIVALSMQNIYLNGIL